MSSVSSKDFKGIMDFFKVQKDVDDKKDLYVSLENARKEWEEAKNIFENVSEPDLVDYAIYNVEAAEQKYVYLLKKIKNESTSEI